MRPAAKTASKVADKTQIEIELERRSAAFRRKLQDHLDALTLSDQAAKQLKDALGGRAEFVRFQSSIKEDWSRFLSHLEWAAHPDEVLGPKGWERWTPRIGRKRRLLRLKRALRELEAAHADLEKMDHCFLNMDGSNTMVLSNPLTPKQRTEENLKSCGPFDRKVYELLKIFETTFPARAKHRETEIYKHEFIRALWRAFDPLVPNRRGKEKTFIKVVQIVFRDSASHTSFGDPGTPSRTQISNALKAIHQ